MPIDVSGAPVPAAFFDTRNSIDLQSSTAQLAGSASLLAQPVQRRGQVQMENSLYSVLFLPFQNSPLKYYEEVTGAKSLAYICMRPCPVAFEGSLHGSALALDDLGG